MRKKADSKQVKANKVLRLSAVAASAESAIREPPPNTWSARMPAYTYTVACPDPELREPPKGVRRYYDPSRKTPLRASEQKAAYIQSFQGPDAGDETGGHP